MYSPRITIYQLIVTLCLGSVVSSELAVLDAAGTGAKERLAAPASHFTGGAHFYEEVEDTKDSVWLVQVRVIVGGGIILEGHATRLAFMVH